MQKLVNTLRSTTLTSLLVAGLASQPALAVEANNTTDINTLKNELETLKAEIHQLKSQTEAIAEQQESNTASSATSEKPQKTSGATLWGYGQINYTNYTNSNEKSKMDLARAVFGIGYRFNDKTRFMSEFEIEHAISSADDEGEVEVEQFYVDHQLTRYANMKAGLFLIPAGLLNENHEPNRFYGVERNMVETAIIPTTWREGGLAFYGTTESGLAWDTGITTTVDLSAWDASSDEGRESPLGSIHQELQLANADDLGVYAALNYRGIPGLVVGGSIFTSKVSQNDPALSSNAKNIRLVLWDTHVRWTQDNWDISALYAQGRFTNTYDLNLTYVGMPTPVPEIFFGGYLQVAYKAWQNGEQALAPFVRYERVNTAATYTSAPLGLGAHSANTETIGTYGLSFFLTENVVFKADYQHYADDDSQNRFNLGIGLAF